VEYFISYAVYEHRMQNLRNIISIKYVFLAKAIPVNRNTYFSLPSCNATPYIISCVKQKIKSTAFISGYTFLDVPIVAQSYTTVQCWTGHAKLGYFVVVVSIEARTYPQHAIIVSRSLKTRSARNNIMRYNNNNYIDYHNIIAVNVRSAARNRIVM